MINSFVFRIIILNSNLNKIAKTFFFYEYINPTVNNLFKTRLRGRADREYPNNNNNNKTKKERYLIPCCSNFSGKHANSIN
jgi:hypothetical protein